MTSVSRNAAHANTANNAADFTVSSPPTPVGSASDPDPDPDLDPTGEEHTIAEIQAPARSPLAGQAVITRGVVTGVYLTGGLAGYYLQTPAPAAAPPSPAAPTSDGIFVFSSATVGQVSVGQYVEVTGEVSEFFGLNRAHRRPRRRRGPERERVAPPAPLQIAWPTTDAGRESIESMLITPQGSFTVSDTFPTNQYGEVTPHRAPRPCCSRPTSLRRIRDDGKHLNPLLEERVRGGARCALRGEHGAQPLDLRLRARRRAPRSRSPTSVERSPPISSTGRMGRRISSSIAMTSSSSQTKPP